ncbi:MAG: serine hydrolase, partial [Bizionia paragorgiae]
MATRKIRKFIGIVLLIATGISLFFVPWIVVKAWLLPLPVSVQEQADEAVGLGFSGIIIYADVANELPK